MRVYELAKKLNLPSKKLVEELKKQGIIVKSHMSSIDGESAELFSQIFGEAKKEEKEEEKKIKAEEKAKAEPVEAKPPEENLVPRPPVVTVMGHIDHGKTSLLDAIRKTNVVSREKGGITQHIGAYRVDVSGRSIVFLDTPGHEAFTAMRERGARATDLVVLVVAADDGVMPQTIEAINHARAAEVAILVAINKIDKPGANPPLVKRRLKDAGIVVEELGGKTICAEVSATTGEGLDNLLEMILLEADILELRANPDKPAEGVIIEAALDKSKGPVATVLIRNGSLSVNDFFVAGASCGKVRAMFDDGGKRIVKAGPSTPMEVLGFQNVPEVGDVFQATESEAQAQELSAGRRLTKREETLKMSRSTTLEDVYSELKEGETARLRLIVKGDVVGSVEVLCRAFDGLGGEKVKLNLVHSGVGEITESDVRLATASKSAIIGFHVGMGEKASRLARGGSVDVRLYRVIYEAIDDVKKALAGLLKPEVREVVSATAEVRQVIKTSRGLVAGCYVREGKLTRNSICKLSREGDELCKSFIKSLRRFKNDAKEVEAGFECGVIIADFNDYKEGDILEVLRREEKEAVL